MAQLTPVTFNEGEPLDVNKLNSLVTNVTNTYTTASQLQNSTTTGTQTITFDASSFDVTTGATANTQTVPVLLPINPKFGTNIPNYIVSIGSEVVSGEVVSIGIKDAKTAPAVVINSNKAKKTYTVNWIAYFLQ